MRDAAVRFCIRRAQAAAKGRSIDEEVEPRKQDHAQDEGKDIDEGHIEINKRHVDGLVNVPGL